MKLGGFNGEFDIESHFDFEGIHYVFRMALFGVGFIGLFHVGLGVMNWLYPGLSDGLGRVAHATQLDRNAEAKVLTRGIVTALSDMGNVITKAQNSMANAYSVVLEGISKTVQADDASSNSNAESLNVDEAQPVPVAPSDIQAPTILPKTPVANAITVPQVQSDQSTTKVVTKPVKKENDAQVAPPQVTAESFLVADMKTGRIFLEKNSNTQYQIASISKLVTALTADKVFGSSDEVYISEAAVKTVSDAGNMKAGEIFSAKDLLYPMLLESSNDAAMAYAMQYDLVHGDGAFVKEMADLSKYIGLSQTSLVEPSGLSPRNISTAKDLFELARYISDHDPRIFAITKIENLEIASSTKTAHHILKNNNVFSKRSDFVGGKTGKTETAQETMLSVFNMPSTSSHGLDEGSNVAIIVLRSNDRKSDTEKLYKWYALKYKNV